MSVSKKLCKTTTHVVLAFAERDQGSKLLEVELLPYNWVYFKDNKWWSLYPSVDEFDRINEWCMKMVPPKRYWKPFEVDILSQCKNYAEGLLHLKRSYKRSNVTETTTESSDGENEQKDEEDANLDDIPPYPKYELDKTSTFNKLEPASRKTKQSMSTLKGFSPTTKKRKRINFISDSEEEEVDENLPEEAAGSGDVSISKYSEKSSKNYGASDKLLLNARPSSSNPQFLISQAEVNVLSGRNENINTTVSNKGKGQHREKDVSFKEAIKDFQSAVLEAKKHDSPHIVNVLEKGFVMMCAKMDSIRQSVQYDVKDGHQKLNASIVLSGVTTTNSLDELKSKFDAPLPITKLNVFLEFDACLLGSVDKKKDCVNLIKALCFGARNANNAIDIVLQQFISKSVQLHYSGKGRFVRGKGKKDFSATQLCGLTLDVFMPVFKETKPLLMSKISRWLSGASDRNGGRKERKIKEILVPEEEE